MFPGAPAIRCDKLRGFSWQTQKLFCDGAFAENPCPISPAPLSAASPAAGSAAFPGHHRPSWPHPRDPVRAGPPGLQGWGSGAGANLFHGREPARSINPHGSHGGPVGRAASSFFCSSSLCPARAVLALLPLLCLFPTREIHLKQLGTAYGLRASVCDELLLSVQNCNLFN